MAKSYAKIVGIVLLIVGVLGFLIGEETEFLGLLQFEPLHNVVHLLTGLIGAWIGYKGSDQAAKQYAWIFGVIYTLLAIAGFAGVGGEAGFLGMKHAMSTAYNVIRLVVGVWGLYAASRKPAAPAPAM